MADRQRNFEEQLLKDAQKISEDYFTKKGGMGKDSHILSQKSLQLQDGNQDSILSDEALFGEIDSQTSQNGGGNHHMEHNDSETSLYKKVSQRMHDVFNV